MFLTVFCWPLFTISFCFYFTTKNVLVCFLFLPLSLYGVRKTARTSQLTAVESLLHIRQGNALWVLSGKFQVGDLAEADKQLETKRGIITRSFPAARLEDPPKCDQVFPTRRPNSVGLLSHSAYPPIRAGKARIILALYEEDACWGYFAPVCPHKPAVVLRRSV